MPATPQSLCSHAAQADRPRVPLFANLRFTYRHNLMLACASYPLAINPVSRAATLLIRYNIRHVLALARALPSGAHSGFNQGYTLQEMQWQ